MKISPLIGRIHIFNNYNLGLICCVATSYSKTNLKSIGGTRIAKYASLNDAVQDAINLAEVMNLKCAVARIPYVGGKSVILKLDHSVNKQKFFKEYGKIIQSLQGEFITGCDVGVKNEDMEMTKRHCNFITGLSYDKKLDQLTYLTALGVFESMKICLEHIKGSSRFSNIHVAVQGVGKVGAYLVELLINSGATVTIADPDVKAIKKFSNYPNCNVVNEKDIFKVECDVFSPCAMGGSINADTIDQLKCSIICGAANNQLFDILLLDQLCQKSIFFMPDWICNIGGTIYASESYLKSALVLEKSEKKVKEIISERSIEFLNFVKRFQLPKGYNMFIENLDISNR